jgi:DNA-binding NarL/FixJ family response regulator
MPITVAIVEDDEEIQEMLARVVTKTPKLSHVGSYRTGEAALAALPALGANVVIMDIQLPGMTGIECARLLKKSTPATQVLVFTVFGDSDQVFRALEAGASGYLLKRTSRKEIIQAIEDVWQGASPMTGEIARKVVESFRHRASSPAKASIEEQLTPREEEVLSLLAKGYVTKEIADLLAIKFDTVRFHLKHIYEKLHVRSRTEALIKYLQ